MEYYGTAGGLAHESGAHRPEQSTAAYREYELGLDNSFAELWRRFARRGGEQSMFHRANLIERCDAHQVDRRILGECECVDVFMLRLTETDQIIRGRFAKNPDYRDAKLDYPELVDAVFFVTARHSLYRRDRQTRGAVAAAGGVRHTAAWEALGDDLERCLLEVLIDAVGSLKYYDPTDPSALHALLSERTAKRINRNPSESTTVDPEELRRRMPAMLTRIQTVTESVMGRTRDHCGELVGWYEARVLHPLSHIPGRPEQLATGLDDGDDGQPEGYQFATAGDLVERQAEIVVAWSAGGSPLERRVLGRTALIGRGETAPLLFGLLSGYLEGIAQGSPKAVALRRAMAQVVEADLVDAEIAASFEEPATFAAIFEAVELTVDEMTC